MVVGFSKTVCLIFQKPFCFLILLSKIIDGKQKRLTLFNSVVRSLLSLALFLSSYCLQYSMEMAKGYYYYYYYPQETTSKFYLWGPHRINQLICLCILLPHKQNLLNKRSLSSIIYMYVCVGHLICLPLDHAHGFSIPTASLYFVSSHGSRQHDSCDRHCQIVGTKRYGCHCGHHNT